jgi:hypothetical protein
MSCPKFEKAIGAVNGTNRVFEVSMDYRPGSIQVFLNGLLLRKDLIDGWVELGAKKIRLHEAPKSSGPCPDVVVIYYIPV